MDSLRMQIHKSFGVDETNYQLALYDLNSDGYPEAIVFVTDSDWCGSGGCTTGIFKKKMGSWKMITKIPITRLPVRILSTKTNGWNDIGVWVQGGGVLKGYEALLPFNGKSYPGNPSVPPAKKLKDKAQGKIVLR